MRADRVRAVALYRSQEALGVLSGDGPVDAADEPYFEVVWAGPAPDCPLQSAPASRADLRLFAAEQRAAERAANNSDLSAGVRRHFQPQPPTVAVFCREQLASPAADERRRSTAPAVGHALARQSTVDVARATLAGAYGPRHPRCAWPAGRGQRRRELVSGGPPRIQAQQVVEIVNEFSCGCGHQHQVIVRTVRAMRTQVAVAEDPAACAFRPAELDRSAS